MCQSKLAESCLDVMENHSQRHALGLENKAYRAWFAVVRCISSTHDVRLPLATRSAAVRVGLVASRIALHQHGEDPRAQLVESLLPLTRSRWALLLLSRTSRAWPFAAWSGAVRYFQKAEINEKLSDTIAVGTFVHKEEELTNVDQPEGEWSTSVRESGTRIHMVVQVYSIVVLVVVSTCARTTCGCDWCVGVLARTKFRAAHDEPQHCPHGRGPDSACRACTIMLFIPRYREVPRRAVRCVRAMWPRVSVQQRRIKCFFCSRHVLSLFTLYVGITTCSPPGRANRPTRIPMRSKWR